MSLKVNNKTYISKTEIIKYPMAKNPMRENVSFKRGNFITRSLIMSDKSPVIGLVIINILAMIVPRTLVDAIRNGFAATETFFREASGLVVNSLTPGLVVYGIAKLTHKMVMGSEFKHLNAHKILANQHSIEAVSNAWLSTTGNKEERIHNTVSKLFGRMEGLVGEEWKKIDQVLPEKTIEHLYKRLSKAILSGDKKRFDRTVKALIKKFGASKNIRFADNTPFVTEMGLEKIGINCSLKEFARDIMDLGKSFTQITDNQIPVFAKKLTKLVNYRSFIGLGVIMSIASVVQWVNRKITKKRTGVDGFVGDPNFCKKIKNRTNEDQKAKIKDKKNLTIHKLINAAAMAGLVLLSFGKIPSLRMFQFNGLFPTMNQCRLVAGSTFIGRIFASDDRNELRESTFRDMFGFANLYLLGEFVAKGVATYMEKRNSSLKGGLLNTTTPFVKKSKNPIINGIKKALHWRSNVVLKGFEEVAKNNKTSRAWAQASGLLYSCIVLGLAIPIYNKWKTEKNVKEEVMSKTNAPTQIPVEFQKIFAKFLNSKEGAEKF
jgi:hypothetical protein